jgi:phage/plasmid-associated DNA primase
MEGLAAPESVMTATAQYEEDSDPLADFLASACEVHPDASIGAGEFYKLYTDWAERVGVTGRDRLSLTTFGRVVTERFAKDRTGASRLYRGVGRQLMSGLGQ